MTKFIKLTCTDTSEFFVACDKIISFGKGENCNYISVIEHEEYIHIKETPEEILKLIAECED